MPRKKYCTNCGTTRESYYERYDCGSDYQCWYCERYTLEEREVQTIQAVWSACGQRIEPYASGSHYCQASGCYRRIYEGNYCSEHRSSSSLNWGYSFSSSGSTCQAEGCSRLTTSSQNYCQPCQQTQNLIRKLGERMNIEQVKDAEEFSAWWNNNLATVVNGESYFSIWLIVYDDREEENEFNRIKKYPTSSNHYGLSNAKNQAFILRGNLNGDNPILYVHPKANSYASFDEIMGSSYQPYVVEFNVPHKMEQIGVTWFDRPPDNEIYEITFPDDIDKTLKPLDVIWIGMEKGLVDFCHVGVYLGEGWVCHFSKAKKGVRIEKIDDFAKDATGSKVIGYRSIIPFGHYKLIAGNIAWAERNYQENNYNLSNINCEHVANEIKYRINFSSQMSKESLKADHKFLNNFAGTTNNGKTSINLANEISQTNYKLGSQSTSWQAQQIERRFANSLIPKTTKWL